jgi:NitT/TauT family transport system ATP-binding protein
MDKETKNIKIRIEKVNKVFKTEKKDLLHVTKNLSLNIYEGEFVAIIGPSGCGKSTLLFMISGLTLPTSGTIYLDDKPISGPSKDRGMVFQQDVVFMWRTVIQNVEFGMELSKINKEIRREKALEAIKLVGLERFVDFYPKELSGGMRKRVAIATVFANDPKVLLMDEPFGSLDYPTKIGLQKVLLNMWEKEKKTTLFVTHDIEEALFLADRIIVLTQGNVNEIYEVPFDRPRTDEMRTSMEFQEIKRKLWKYLE